MLKFVSSFLFLAVLFVSNAFSLSTYALSVSNQSSVVVASSQHGFNSDKIAVHVYNAQGDRLPDSVFTKSVNPSTFSASITFASPFTGTVKLTGPFTESGVTNAQRDFDAAVIQGEKAVKICSACTANNPAFAGAGTKKYYSVGSVSYVAPATVASAVFVYLDAGRMVFQVGSAAEAGSVSGGPAEVRVQSGGFPSGVERLHELSFTSQPSSAPTITERRGWL